MKNAQKRAFQFVGIVTAILAVFVLAAWCYGKLLAMPTASFSGIELFGHFAAQCFTLLACLLCGRALYKVFH